MSASTAKRDQKSINLVLVGIAVIIGQVPNDEGMHVIVHQGEAVPHRLHDTVEVDDELSRADTLQALFQRVLAVAHRARRPDMPAGERQKLGVLWARVQALLAHCSLPLTELPVKAGQFR